MMPASYYTIEEFRCGKWTVIETSYDNDLLELYEKLKQTYIVKRLYHEIKGNGFSHRVINAPRINNV